VPFGARALSGSLTNGYLRLSGFPWDFQVHTGLSWQSLRVLTRIITDNVPSRFDNCFAELTALVLVDPTAQLRLVEAEALYDPGGKAGRTGTARLGPMAQTR
jgi:hypothetical protein